MDSLDDVLKEKATSIFRYLRKMGVSHDDAQDVVQDTLCKVILLLHELDRDRLGPWMFRVAYNQYIDLVRKRKRRAEIPIETLEFISKRSLEDEVLNHECKEDIQATMEQMNPKYKHMLILKYECDFSYKEMAEVFSTTEEVVKMSLYRARQQFQQLYRRVQHEHG
ncbi:MULTISPECIES: RNA polymerase sigma factor [Paenibacillus]|uniref:RNA polymerase sigma factor n=1 Tax=Paenibacillus TaxID=44249 RepID=UPI0012D8EA71|nr:MULTISPECIES: sigma-70 family RNA polymerase sigma factor [Paenibacillus]